MKFYAASKLNVPKKKQPQSRNAQVFEKVFAIMCGYR